MAASVLVDAGFVIALLSRRDRHHTWAVAQSPGHPPPWKTCDAVLSEAFHLLGARGRPALSARLRRGAVVPAFQTTTRATAATLPVYAAILTVFAHRADAAPAVQVLRGLLLGRFAFVAFFVILGWRRIGRTSNRLTPLTRNGRTNRWRMTW